MPERQSGLQGKADMTFHSRMGRCWQCWLAPPMWKEDGQQDPQLHGAAVCQPWSRECCPTHFLFHPQGISAAAISVKETRALGFTNVPRLMLEVDSRPEWQQSRARLCLACHGPSVGLKEA